ncbi:unnamed protein product, partial [Iphiclides podalirius]
MGHGKRMFRRASQTRGWLACGVQRRGARVASRGADAGRARRSTAARAGWAGAVVGAWCRYECDGGGGRPGPGCRGGRTHAPVFCHRAPATHAPHRTTQSSRGFRREHDSPLPMRRNRTRSVHVT